MLLGTSSSNVHESVPLESSNADQPSFCSIFENPSGAFCGYDKHAYRIVIPILMKIKKKLFENYSELKLLIDN